MNLKELVCLIREKHLEAGIHLNPPVTLSELLHFEKEIGFPLPPDFRDFYLVCNGFICEEDLFTIVPLEQIRRYPQDFGGNWFYFSEYMIYSDMWGLRFTSNGQFEIFNGSYPEKSLTSSLTKFLWIFLTGNVFDTGGLYDWQKELGINNVH